MKRVPMNIIFIALIFFSIFFSLHWFVWKTAVFFFDIQNIALSFKILIGMLLLGVSFLPATLIAFRYYNVFTRAFYILASLWEGLFVYLLAASAVLWILYGALHFFIPFPKMTAAVILFSSAFVLCIYGLWNASHIHVTDIKVALPNLPSEWSGKTAVWISDTHFDQVRAEASAKKVSGMITDLHPDIVFIGGDFFDGSATNYDAIAGYFNTFNAPFGTFFVTGNHEEFSGNDNNNKYINAIKNAGIKILNNEKVEISGLQLIGVDYENTRKQEQFKKILTELNISTSSPSILLKHAPDGLEQSNDAGISFQISGHTHKGQVFPGSLLTHAIFGEYDYGLHTYKNMNVYTSSGAGTFGPPMRVGTIAEIVRITFAKR
jgi:predicted MPP superfamily phosphohydrolase